MVKMKRVGSSSAAENLEETKKSANMCMSVVYRWEYGLLHDTCAYGIHTRYEWYSKRIVEVEMEIVRWMRASAHFHVQIMYRALCVAVCCSVFWSVLH